jgi:parallel beta-helix repeat protein
MRKLIPVAALALLWQCATSQVVINEIVASNTRGAYDPDFGEFGDWIELRNTGTTDLSLGGWTLSDDSTKLKKWVFPKATVLKTGAYLVVYADNHNKYPGNKATVQYTDATSITVKEHHANFAVSADGESIILSNASGKQVDRVKFGEQQADISYGRNQLTSQWMYWGTPTPGSANAGPNLSKIQIATPALIQGAGGVHQGSVSIELSTSQPQGVIKYTLDGSTPTQQSATYTGAITSDSSVVVCAIVMSEGFLPSPVQSRSFIVDGKHHLPVVCITTDDRHLWAKDFGIYQNGLKDREVPIHIEMYDTAGNEAFSSNAGMTLFGSMIFQLPQKPMGIYFKNKYGTKSIDYKLFGDKDISQFSSFILRNGGNDYNLTMFRDAMVSTVVAGQMDIDYMAYQPTAVYLNGKYWGLYNIREKQNSGYLEQNHHIATDKLDVLEDSLLVNEGSDLFYNKLMEYVRNTDATSPSFYTGLEKLMDIDNYINLMTTKIYGGYYIWFMNNKYWVERKPGGRWRWFLFDLEHTFAGPSGDGYMENTLQKTLLSPNPLQPAWSTELFRVLMSNKEFSDRFVQTFAYHANTTFAATRVNGIIDSLKNNINSEMQRHIARWHTPGSTYEWENNVAQMKQFATMRPNNIFTQFISALKLTGTIKVTITTNLAQGSIVFNDTRVQAGQVSGKFFKSIPFSLKAVANPGYRFVRFDGIGTMNPDSISSATNLIITAVFEATPANLLPDTVRGTLTLVDNGMPYMSIGDIVIPAGSSLIVNEGVEILMAPGASIFDYGYLHFKGTANKKVTIRANQNPVGGKPGKDYTWGAISARSPQDSLVLEYAEFWNASSGKDLEAEAAAINVHNGKVRIDHVAITDAVNPIHCEQSAVLIANCYLRSDYTCDLLNIYNCIDPIITDNELVGSPAIDADAMDLGFITRGIIRNNRIYGFTGFNSDGIDLGEACDSVLIEGNYIYGNDDKGVSIGGGSEGILRQNVIVECGKGVGIKDSISTGFIHNNTFYGCGVALACYEKKEGRGGGKAIVTNTIIAKSKTADMYIDPFSRSSVTYCLSDDSIITGEHNFVANPRFISASMRDFNLETSSPCINSGDPRSPKDPDGSRADIGARFTRVDDTTNTVVVNELFYAPKSGMNTGDWIELLNVGTRPIDLSFWTLYDDNNDNAFSFPINSVILPGEHLVIPQNPDSLRKYQPSWNGKSPCSLAFGLSDKGDELHLLNQDMLPVFDLTFNNKNNWAAEPAQYGNSLERFEDSPTLSSRSWYASHAWGGTPGAKNSTSSAIKGLAINEIIPAFADNAATGVELFNSGTARQSLRGIYLTNDKSKPCLQYIPLNSSIDSISPAAFALLGTRNTNGFTLPFSPFTDSGFTGLVQIVGRDTLWIDSVSYRDLPSEFTWGRYPDGAATQGVMKRSTNHTNNKIEQPETTSLTELPAVFLYPNPCTTVLHVASANDKASIQIVDQTGRTVMNCNACRTIAVENLLPGLYFVKIKTETSEVTKRIIKR